eukprot:TRINITY_DN27500_c0_g1_i1.p1 TRINITY_DN27500_c0_g1~~TRINITY_DN27500_c0_g1_i1.p1  ORF type:complete len:197 (+),score=35.27 TRINITY_DN27500_c0_g1_i1:111-701(+)
MCGAGGSILPSWGKSDGASSRKVPGKRILDDAEFQDLLKGWKKLRVHFAGVMLMAEGKETVEAYDPERNKWATTETISGKTGLVLKTSGDGWLHLRLEERGFRWEHVACSYRRVGKSSQAPELEVVEDSSLKFSVQDLEDLLDEQRFVIYQDGTRDELADFAKRIYAGIVGHKAGGSKPNKRFQEAVERHKEEHAE